MEEDSEVLDWGNEDDETQVSESLRAHPQQKQSDSGAAWSGGDQEEAEDAVSLGGDEDEEVYAYPAPDVGRAHTPRPQDSSSRASSQQRSSVDRRHEPQQRDSFGNSAKPTSWKTEPPQVQRAQSLGKLMHALPPKPIVAPPPFIPPATVHPSILASSMIPRERERRSNGHSKSVSNSQETPDILPPDWEVRYPRSGPREAYYYNVRTHESTWTRPRSINSRRSSPSKEREGDNVLSGDGRSPVRGITDESPRDIRTDTKRRVSPGGSLSYEDRHYRPEGQNGSDQQTVRNETYSTSPRSNVRPPSPPSRVPGERRVVRSPSPPPRRRSRSAERPGRGSRRDISPSASDRNTWRDLPRDDLHSRQSPLQERVWSRSRDLSSPENNTARSYDNRPPVERGRRHRMDVVPPVQSMPISQDIRNNANAEWSPPRHRSPPSHLRESSPSRRAPPPDLPQRPPSPRYRSRFDGPSSLIVPKEPPRTLLDPYISAETVPQRRTRDFDAEYGNDVKRRRMDESADDSRYRPLTEDRFPPVSLPDRPSSTSHSMQSEQLRPRRNPLPSQSDRFRDAVRHPLESDTQLPIASSSSQMASPPLTVDDIAPRGTNRGFRDIPLGPRSHSQFPQAPLDSERGDTMPPMRTPATSGRMRTRFDTPAAGPATGSSTVLSDRPRDAMDIDYPTRLGAPGTDEVSSRTAVSSRNDHPPAESSLGTVPTGPRAMSRSVSGYGPQREPSFTTALPTPVSFQGSGANSRPPPARSPPLRQARDRMEPPQNVPRAGTQGLPQGPRGYEISRNVPGPPDAKSQESRSHLIKGSGRNSIPLGDKGSSGPQERTGSSRVAPDGWRDPTSTLSGPGAIIYETEPRRPPSTYTPVSPTSNYRSLPATGENPTQRMPASDRRVAPPMHAERSYTPPFNSQPPPKTRRDVSPQTSSDRSGRMSRFGPEPAQPPPPSKPEERVWLTREESMRLDAQNQRNSWASQTRARSSRFSEALPRQDSMTRTAVDEPPPRHLEQHERAPQARGSQETTVDSRQRTRPPSLERRMSSQAEPPPVRGILGRIIPPVNPLRVNERPPSLEGRMSLQAESPFRLSGRPIPPVPNVANPRANKQWYDSPIEMWQRPTVWDLRKTAQAQQSSPPADKVQAERAQLIDGPVPQNDRQLRTVERRFPDSSLPPPPVREPSPKPKPPVRIRRPAKSPMREESEPSRPPRERDSPEDRPVAAGPPLQRPPVQRGGSLLERLTLDGPSHALSTPSPSLRERVELPMKRPGEDIHGLPPRPSVEVTNDAESNMDARGGRGGGIGLKRRNGKVKRGKR